LRILRIALTPAAAFFPLPILVVSVLVSPIAAAQPPDTLPAATGLEAAGHAPMHGPGITIESAASGIPPALLDCRATGSPCIVLVRAGRSDLADPAPIERLLDAAGAAGLRVVVRLVDDGWPRPDLPIEEWTAAVESLAARTGPRVAAWQILDVAAAADAPPSYAYLLKRTSVILRGFSPGAPIITGVLRPGDAAWSRALFENDAAPYVDILGVESPAALEPIVALRDAIHPSAGLWVTDAPVSDRARAAAAAEYLEALHAGASVVLFRDRGGPASFDPAGLAFWLRGIAPPSLSPAATAILPFDPGPGVASRTFFDPKRRTGMVLYRRDRPAGPAETPDAPPAPPAGPDLLRAGLRAPVDMLELADPGSLSIDPLPGVPAPAGAMLALPVRDTALVLRFRLATAAIPVQETLAVGATTDLTAEEIIARERQVGALQVALLDHYETQATVGIHYRLAVVSESVDLVSRNRLFVKEGRQDFEQLELHVGGARWRGKEPPHLPFIQPDKVQEMPLDITLDEGYRYRLVGRNRVDGRDCYELEFTAVTRDAARFEGRVFIDAQRFARVRMDAVQIGLKEPLRSNHVIWRFAPVESGGHEFWLPVEIRGQMTFEVLGHNLVVEREAVHADFVVNAEGFEDRRRAALLSGRPVFRETDEGYQRVEMRDGKEVVRPIEEKRNTFFVFGASTGFDGNPGLPFAGVNFFDFDFRGSGTEFDFAWAGPFAEIAWTDPDVGPAGFGRRLSTTVGGSFTGIQDRDKNATAEGTFSNEYLDLLRNSVYAGISLPLGHFSKATLQATAAYVNFSRHDKTDPAFVVPVDHRETDLTLRFEYNRLGYTVGLWGQAGRRSDWGPWGLPDDPPFDPDTRSFTRRGLDIRKGFYFGPLQKVSAAVSLFDGDRLDRFSRFEIGDFRAASVRGFGGSGIHFDRGAVAELAYGFTLGGSFRIDAAVEHAWMENEPDFGPGTERALGGGLSLNFSGPWSTLVHVRMSRGFSSTIPETVGTGDLRVTFFRTFDHWGRRKPPPPGDPAALP
jgi:hypothetical protein